MGERRAKRDREVVQRVMVSLRRRTAAATYLYISRLFRRRASTALVEGAKVDFDVVDNRGKQAAENLQVK